jgi:hypothetical protein
MAIHFQGFGSMYLVALQVGRPISRGIAHSPRTLELSTVQFDQGLFPLPIVSLRKLGPLALRLVVARAPWRANIQNRLGILCRQAYESVLVLVGSIPPPSCD